MAEILLVHGSGHGAWCWRDAIPELQALGHHVRAIDLPGSGQDRTPVTEVTLEACAGAILDAAGPDTVLLGHSWGGFPISAAAEAAPERFAGLIYLCAYVPVPGQSMLDMRKAGPRQTLGGDALGRAADGSSYWFTPKAAREMLYPDCTPAQQAYALEHLTPQATRPQADPISLGAAYARVPRSYILCTRDRVIPPEYQARMVEGWPPDRVQRLDTGHSPFFADPAALAAAVDRAAATF